MPQFSITTPPCIYCICAYLCIERKKKRTVYTVLFSRCYLSSLLMMCIIAAVTVAAPTTTKANVQPSISNTSSPNLMIPLYHQAREKQCTTCTNFTRRHWSIRHTFWICLAIVCAELVKQFAVMPEQKEPKKRGTLRILPHAKSYHVQRFAPRRDICAACVSDCECLSRLAPKHSHSVTD